MVPELPSASSVGFAHVDTDVKWRTRPAPDEDLKRDSPTSIRRGWRSAARRSITRMGDANSLRVRILVVAVLAMAPIVAIGSAMALDEAAEAGHLPTFLAWVTAAALPVLIGAAGILAISIVVETWILRWLDYLERVAKAYGRGRYSVRPRKIDQAPAEFRALGQAVGDMAEAVEQRDRDLRTALEEQTLLLREVHHRVKNNLQIVGSLLSLQAARSDDLGVKYALQDALFRLDAMALAQRFMQDDEGRNSVSVSTVFEAWSSQFRARLGADSRRLDLRILVDERALPLEFASPLVLIANEAVMCAYRCSGEAIMACNVAVTDSPDGVVLCLELPGGSSFDWSKTVSSDLINGYVRQLRGRLDLSDASHLTVEAPRPRAA
jgi:HAMP domain-containing protein